MIATTSFMQGTCEQKILECTPHFGKDIEL